jgi:cyanate permease
MNSGTAVTPVEKASTGNQPSSDPAESSYRWVMLTLLALLYASFGVVTRSIAPLTTPTLRDLQLSYSQMGLILGSWQLTFIGGSIVAGLLIDRWGIRKSLFIGVLTVSLSSLLRSLPSDFTGMLLAVMLFGAGAPMISIGGPKAIALWFKGKSRGRAMGIYFCGCIAGQLFALTLTNSLMMPLLGHSWRLTFLWYGLFSLGIAAAWACLGKEAPSPGTEGTPGLAQTFRRLTRIRTVQIVLAMGFLAFATNHGFNHWLPKILETGGMPPNRAGFVAAIPIVVSMAAVLIIPGMVPSGRRGFFIALLSFLNMVALPFMVTSPGIPRYVALIIYGIAHATFAPILLLILMDTKEIESRFLGAAGGMFFCIAEIGGFSGPLMMGALVDVTGSFLAGTFSLAFLNLAMIGLTLLLRTRPTPR